MPKSPPLLDIHLPTHHCIEETPKHLSSTATAYKKAFICHLSSKRICKLRTTRFSHRVLASVTSSRCPLSSLHSSSHHQLPPLTLDPCWLSVLDCSATQSTAIRQPIPFGFDYLCGIPTFKPIHHYTLYCGIGRRSRRDRPATRALIACRHSQYLPTTEKKLSECATQSHDCFPRALSSRLTPKSPTRGFRGWSPFWHFCSSAFIALSGPSKSFLLGLSSTSHLCSFIKGFHHAGLVGFPSEALDGSRQRGESSRC